VDFTRKGLKSDKFQLEVQHSVTYVSEHRQQMIRWGGIALGVVVLAAAFYLYRSHEHSVRQADLHAAMQIQNSSIGPASNEYQVAFPTPADRYKAIDKAFTDITRKYPGTDEATIADYFLATNAADQGKVDEAEKHLKIVADSGTAAYASMAKLALAQIYAAKGKIADGEKLIQSVIDKPTVLVSKEQATIELAVLIGPTQLDRARKLLEPLRSSGRPNVSKAAISALSDLPKK